jgi:uncharacterized protein YegP (UPF0339 family)
VKFEIFRNKETKKFYCRIRHRNGRIGMHSQGFNRKASAEKNALATIVGATLATIVFVK